MIKPPLKVTVLPVRRIIALGLLRKMYFELFLYPYEVFRLKKVKQGELSDIELPAYEVIVQILSIAPLRDYCT